MAKSSAIVCLMLGGSALAIGLAPPAAAQPPAAPPPAAAEPAADAADPIVPAEAMQLFNEDRLAESEPLFRRLIAEREATLGADHPRTLGLLFFHATILRQLQRPAEGEALLRRFLAAPEPARRAAAVDDEVARIALAYMLLDQQRAVDAGEILVDTLEAAWQNRGQDHEYAIAAREGIVAAFRQLDRPETVASQLEGLIASLERADPSGPRLRAYVPQLADAYRALERTADEEAQRLRLVELERAASGDDSIQTVNATIQLGQYYARNARHADAATHLGAALAAIDRAGLAENDAVGGLIIQLVTARLSAGQRDAVNDDLLRRNLALRERLHGPDLAEAIEAVEALAAVFSGQGRAADLLPLQQRLYAARLATLGPGHQETLRAQLNLALLQFRLEQFAEAEASLLELAPRVRAAQGPESGVLVVIDTTLVSVYERQLRFTETERLLVRLVDDYDRIFGPADRNTLDMVQRLGALYSSQRRFAEAEPLLRRALAGIEQAHGADSREALAAVEALAPVEIGRGNVDQGLALYERAVRLSEALYGAEEINTVSAHNNLAQAYRDQGRRAEAQASIGRAIEIAQRRFPQIAHMFMAVLADLHVAEGRPREAERVLADAAASIPEDLGTDQAIRFFAGSAARARLLQPDRAAIALPLARMAVEITREQRGNGAADRYLAAEDARRRENDHGDFEQFADAAWSAAAARPEELATLRTEAFRALQEAISGEADRAVARMAARRSAEQMQGGLGALAQEREVLNDQWTTNRETMAATFADAGEDARELRALLENQRTGIEQRLDAIDAQLRADFPDYFSLIEPAPVPVEEAQALIAADEAILIVVPTEFGTHAMLVTAGGLEWHRSALTSGQVNEAVQKLRWDLGASVTVPADTLARWNAEVAVEELPGFDRATAYRLHQELVAPFAAGLAGKRRLYIAAGGVLTGLPFSVLVAAPPQGDDTDAAALRATRWLAFEHGLVHIPSIQALAQLRRRAGGAGPAGTGFAGIGDPLLEGAATSRGRGLSRGGPRASAASLFPGTTARSPGGGAIADQGVLRSLERLPGTARELESLRQAFDAPAGALMLAGRAREAAVRSADLSGVSVLAFATHGLTADESNELAEAGLVMTPPPSPSAEDDGYLAASEVAALRLNADWVILSACNTATGDGTEGLSGLARAFLYAGTRSMLASHWPVDDNVAPVLIVRTVELERGGQGRAEAFQQAMREVRDDASRDAAGQTRAHPYFWAPFVLLGDGG